MRVDFGEWGRGRPLPFSLLLFSRLLLLLSALQQLGGVPLSDIREPEVPNLTSYMGFGMLMWDSGCCVGPLAACRARCGTDSVGSPKIREVPGPIH